MNEDNNKGTVTASTSGETTNTETAATNEAKDIDFKKVAEELDDQTPKKSKYSPEEKVKKSLHFIAEQAKELGVDPAEALGIKPKTPEIDTSNFVTKTDMARNEARNLAKSDDEFKVIMWYVENKGLSVEDAHFMANKPRFKNTIAEIQRGNVKPPEGAADTSGQKPKVNLAPERHPDHDVLSRRGFKMVKPGLYQAKFYQARFDETTKTWIQEKIVK